MRYRLFGVMRPASGMTFTRMYTEPSCTPTRAAALTGRHPIRNGMVQVIFPVHGIGLPQEEVTIAEILSKNGYNTAFFGKAHQGDLEESYLHNQGFDIALFSTYNQFASQFFNTEGEQINMTIAYTEDQWDKHGYAIDQNFRYRGEDIVWAVEGRKGEQGTRWTRTCRLMNSSATPTKRLLARWPTLLNAPATTSQTILTTASMGLGAVRRDSRAARGADGAVPEHTDSAWSGIHRAGELYSECQIMLARRLLRSSPLSPRFSGGTVNIAQYRKPVACR